MGTFRELNPYSYTYSYSYSCGACILMIREPDDAISTCLEQSYFKDYLKLLERRKLELMQKAGTYSCSGEISVASTLTSSKAANI